MSYFELSVYVNDYAADQKAINNANIDKIKYQSWVTAALVLSGIGGKFPKLEEILQVEDKNKIDIKDEKRIFKSLKVRTRMLRMG